MKAKKIVRWVVTVLVVIIVAFVIIFNIAGDSLIRKGIEVGASDALGVNVTVEKVKLSLLGANFSADDLVVGNPQGYKTPSMFEMKKMFIDTSIGGIIGDTIVIDEIVFDGMTVTLEQKGLTNNIQQVLKGINEKAASEEKPEQPKEQKSEGKKIVIKKLLINEATVKASMLTGEKTVSFTLSPIEMNDLGTDKPMDIAVLSGKILAAIAGGIVKSGAGLLPSDMLGPMSDTIGQATKLLGQSGKVLDAGKEAGTQVLEKSKEVGEGIKNVGEGIKGIFNKKE